MRRSCVFSQKLQVTKSSIGNKAAPGREQAAVNQRLKSKVVSLHPNICVLTGNFKTFVFWQSLLRHCCISWHISGTVEGTCAGGTNKHSPQSYQWPKSSSSAFIQDTVFSLQLLEEVWTRVFHLEKFGRQILPGAASFEQRRSLCLTLGKTIFLQVQMKATEVSCHFFKEGLGPSSAELVGLWLYLN